MDEVAEESTLNAQDAPAHQLVTAGEAVDKGRQHAGAAAQDWL